MRFRKVAAGSAILTILLVMGSTPSFGQEHDSDPESSPGEHPAADHEYHRNHFGGLVGVSKYSNADNAAFTLGLEYARQFATRWAAVVYLESVSSNLERDVVVAAGIAFYPIPRMGIIVAPAVETVEKEKVVHGETETEKELGFLLRLGAGYGFPLTPQAALGPIVFVDHADERWTTILGVVMVVGF